MTNITGAALAALLALPCLGDEPRVTKELTFSDTRVQVYGTLWVNSWYYFDQNLKDNGTLVPIDPMGNALNPGSTPDRQFGMTAKNSQIGFTSVTPSARWGEIKTVIEMDFAKDQAKNGAPNLRHAYVNLGGWTFGHTWSNWLDTDSVGATVDLNGPIGQACNGSSRYTQVRYTFHDGRRNSLAFSVEQNVHAWDKFVDVTTPPPPTNPPTPNAPAPVPAGTRPDARYPTLVGAYTFADDWGHMSLRAMTQNYGAYTPAAPGSPELRPNQWGTAGQLTGVFNLGVDQLVGSIYTGRGLGEYGAGFQGARLEPGATGLELYRNVGWQVGYARNWTSRVRSNLVLGGVNFNADAAAQFKDIRNAFNGFLNTFVKLDKRVELGLEYGYERFATFGPNAVTQRNGTLSDRNHSRKIQASLTAKF